MNIKNILFLNFFNFTFMSLKINKLIIFLLLMFSMKITAQNLVPNPSFEDTIACPTGIAQLYNVVGWEIYSATPDYFNGCVQNTLYSVPYNQRGYQYAATGNAYCGFYSQAFLYNYREYIGRQLADPLIIGQKYYVSFKVVLVEGASCATNNLGILFSTIPHIDSLPGDFNFGPTYNFAHVYTSNIITDTANWVTISGSFTADSAYQYIQIGNFFDDSNTDTLMIDSLSTFCVSYYFVDDICVSTDSLNCDVQTSVIQKNIQQKITIYPNPAKSFLNVKIPITFSEIAVMKIYNLMGDLMSEYIIQSPVNKIQLPNIRTGIYILSIQTKDLTIHKKLVILN